DSNGITLWLMDIIPNRKSVSQRITHINAFYFVLFRPIIRISFPLDIENVKKYERLGIPMFVVCSKTDIMPKEEIAPNLLKLSEAGVESDIFPVSARKGRGIRQLEEDIVSVLPEGNKVFEEDIISDKSKRFMIAEIMREKILLKYDKEIPHGVAIVVHTFEKRPAGNLYDIGLDIVCDKQNHKAILIGKQGQALKEVSAFARQDMEKFLGAKVFLTTYVKVEEGWREKQKLIREFGYEEPN
ncbi:MAG: GTPase Era, partial [Christensenellaceae bacterium]